MSLRVPVVAFVLSLTPTLALSQSLGDAARQQARERKTAAPAPATARAYSDADLHPETDAHEAVPADGAEPRATAADDAPQPHATAAEDPVRVELDREAAEEKKRELYWRAAMAVARAALASAQREADAVCGPGVLVLTGG